MTKMKFFVGVAVFALAFFAGTEANAAYMHSMTLKMGMTNVQVKALQQQLNMTSCKVSVIGVGSAGYETMYFGAKTKAAVQCFQMANGLVADGIVGPMTGSKLAGASGNVVVVPVCPPGFTCTPAGGSTGGSTGGTTTGGLSGTVGSLDYTLVSSLSNEDVGEGDNNVKVAGLELDADDSDSDVRITAVKLNFDVGTAGSDFEDYAEEVSVWFGSTKVATVDADEFNDDNDFEKTVSLSGDTIVRKGDSENLYVAISAVSNLDTNDINDTWTVDFTQIRFVDAQGAVTTEADAAIGTAARTFTFKSFASANDVDLVVDLNDDEEDINLAHVVNVESGATDTEDVEVLAFTLEAEGDSDIDVTEIPATLTTTGETDESLILIQAKLWHDGEVIATDSSIAAGGAVLFDELDLTIEAGDTEEFIISVDLQDLTGALDEGDTVQASITTTNA
jgi:hypothetical protein